MNNMNTSLDLKNLFLGNAIGKIGNEGEVQLKGSKKVKVKNLVEKDIEDGKSILAVMCRKSKKYYILHSNE